MIYPDCDMKRWSHCDNSVVLANADYYYTKEQVDKKFDDFDGVTDEEVQRMINTSIRTKADKADVNALSGQVQANTDAIGNTYTKQETNAAVTAATTPINNTLTAHTADTSIHVTSAEKTYWNNKLDASAYTPTDLSNYYTKGQTDDLLDEKLDASAYTPTDLSNYYTKQETNEAVNGAVSGKADTTYVNQVATQATEAIGGLNTRIGTVETTLGGQIESLYANKFGYASYDSQTQRINFYNHSNSQDVLAYVDATDFIKDGMVSNVEISNGNLVITFNSDAGKQPISIPLTDIFNPANYYTTAQTQSYVSGFTYDKATIDQKVAEGGTFDPDLYYDKTATDALLAAKADKTECLGDVKIDTAWSYGSRLMTYKADGSGEQTRGYFSKINGNYIATNYSFNTMDFQLVEKSAITSAITSSSTNSEVAGAKAVYDAIDAAIDGKADTSAVTAVNDALTAHTSDTGIHVSAQEKNAWNAKAEPYSAGTGIEISGNVISATGGGGATYSAGTNISIDTANTINCTLNARNGSGTDSLIIGDSECSATRNYSIAVGHNADAVGNTSIVIGSNASSNAAYSFVHGTNCTVYDSASNATHCFIFGNQIKNIKKSYNTAFGEQLSLSNNYETAFGTYNNSVTGSTASGQTLFSVGNGTSSARHNAFEVRQNGDIYIALNGQDVKLQDQLGGGGGVTVDPTLDSGSTNPVANSAITNAINAKVATSDFNTYTAATATALNGKADSSAVTQVNDALTAHTADTSVHVTAAEKAEWDDKAEVIELTQAQYDALVTKDPDVLYVISDAAPAEVIITTTITSSSTNGEAASAKAVYDQMGGLKLVSLTQAQYDALSTKDASTIYFING